MLRIAIALALTLTASAAHGSALETEARTMTQALADGAFSKVTARFDARLSTQLPEERLRMVWRNFVEQFGEFVAIRMTRTQAAQGYTVVFVTCQMLRSGVDVQFAFDGEGKVAGLFMRPNEALGAASGWSPPRYAKPDTLEEVETTVGRAPFELPGVLTLPKTRKGKVPGVVLLHGSGPNDRDETVGGTKVFKDLAWGLASRGIATLRYDKRTKVHGEALAKRVPRLTFEEEVVEDALFAVAQLVKDRRIGRVFVLGHSFGGTMAPLVALRDKRVRGLISLAGAVSPIEDLAAEQMVYLGELDGKIEPAEAEQIASVGWFRARVKRKALKPDERLELLGAPTLGAYWIALRNYDPIATAVRQKRPILFLQGGREYQVPPRELVLWEKGIARRVPIESIVYPKLNHIFVTGEGPSHPREYAAPANVEAKVVADIAKWIQKRR